MSIAQAPAVAGDDVEVEERTGPRKRVIAAIVGGIALVAALWFGIPWFVYSHAHESTDDARIDASTVLVNSKIAERVASIAVDTNQAVKKGQLLIVLDETDERAKLAQARANYDMAIANQRTLSVQGQGGVSSAAADIGGSQAGVGVASAQLAATQAQVPAAQQAYQKAQADLARTQSLVSTGDIPRAQLDTVRAQAAAAAAQLRAAQYQVGVASANVAASQQRVGAAQGGLTTAQGRLAQSNDPSQVEGAKAQLDLVKQLLGYTKIYSPIDGYVGEKSVEIGQTVNPGVPLLTIIPSRVFVTANFKETQIGAMRPGQPVDIHVDAYKGVTFTGTLASINPASQGTYALVPAQNSTGNFVKVTQRIPVKIVFDSSYDAAKYPMRPGMSVEASVKVR
jgi:membrane fusion protein (multidrug efflux system)